MLLPFLLFCCLFISILSFGVMVEALINKVFTKTIGVMLFLALIVSIMWAGFYSYAI